jgi:uncharacterized protein YndB with AHSA1/START domain
MVTVASSGSAAVTLPTDTQIHITRTFDAPRHLVYRAYTEPDLIKRWWSGERGEVTSVEVDLRVGGRWRYVMVANAGFEVAFHGEFRQIVPNERIVNTEVFEMPEPDTMPDDLAPVVTTTFEEHEGRTTMIQVIETGIREVRDAIIASGMEGGMQEAMDRLERVAMSLG